MHGAGGTCGDFVEYHFAPRSSHAEDFVGGRGGRVDLRAEQTTPGQEPALIKGVVFGEQSPTRESSQLSAFRVRCN